MKNTIEKALQKNGTSFTHQALSYLSFTGTFFERSWKPVIMQTLLAELRELDHN